jgi:flagella basal body P-ring formation protein FlgA
MNTKRRKSATWLPTGILLLAAAGAVAEEAVESQSHDSIREAARQHALADTAQRSGRVEVTVGSLDSRLRLAACDRPLSTYDSPNGLNGGRGVVGVRCEGSRPWKLFVPVQLAQIEPVVVSRRPLARGQTLQAEDLALSEIDVSGVHRAYFSRIEDLVGMRSKRSLPSGEVLHAGLLEREQLVRRGSQVEILADTAGLQVRMRGKAMADGGRGDLVKVKNLSSGRVVSGTVEGPGLIRVMH